jgi:MFS family permease
MQITRSSGAAIGSLVGGYLANLFGRRLTYFLISAICLVVSGIIYRFLTPLNPWFPAWVFVLGIVGVAYFGWLPLYLPELFPTRVRSTGTGVAFNFGRIIAIPCVLGAGYIHGFFGGDYAKVGQFTSLVYLLGMLVACLAPDTSKRDLKN